MQLLGSHSSVVEGQLVLVCDCTAGSPVFGLSKEHVHIDQAEICLTACILRTKARTVRNVGNHLPNDAASRHVLRASNETDCT
jgi:hypothetical protein